MAFRKIEKLEELFRKSPDYLDDVEFKVAEDFDQIKKSLHLVYKQYIKRGYTDQNPHKLKATRYQLLPTTTTFVADHARLGIIGTVTLIEDTPLGLPMDNAFKVEVDVLRMRRSHLAEASMLCIDTETIRELLPRHEYRGYAFRLTLSLFKVMFDYFRDATVADTMVCCFNPRHRCLYDFIQLHPLAGIREYPNVNGHLGEARYLYLPRYRKQAANSTGVRYLYSPAAPNQHFEPLRSRRLLEEELNELSVKAFVSLRNFPKATLDYLQQCYPGYRFQGSLSESDPLSVL